MHNSIYIQYNNNIYTFGCNTIDAIECGNSLFLDNNNGKNVSIPPISDIQSLIFLVNKHFALPVKQPSIYIYIYINIINIYFINTSI